MKNSERLSWRFQAKERFQSRVWPAIHRLAAPVVWLRRRLRPHRIPLCRVEGTVKGGDQPLTMLFGGENQNKHYFLDLALADKPAENSLGEARLLDVFRAGCGYETDASLVALITNESLHDWLNDDGWFFLPFWITGDSPLPVPEKCLQHDSIKTSQRKIRKHGYEYEVTQDEERFKQFYHTMYLPYATKAFGDAVTLDSDGEKRGGTEVFDLVLVRKHSQPDVFLGGFLIIYEAAGPRLWSVGVLDGNRALVQEGVLAALYIFCLDHLAKKGFKRVNMGGSRPFLRDGVLRFKRKFSLTLLTSRWRGYSLKILSLTPATKTFLLNNPFIFRTNGRFYGAVFTEAALSAETIERIDHDHYYNGLDRLLIYTFNEAETFTVSGLPPELAARIEIRSANEVVSGKLRLPAPGR